MPTPVLLRTTRAPSRPRRVHVEQHGCATTEGEAAMIAGILTARGHVLAPTLEEADAVVLVTCTVIERTERTMLRRIRELSDSGRTLLVSGCMAGAQVGAIKHAAPGALVLPPAYLHQAADLLDEGVAEFCYAPKVGLPKVREGVVETVVINEGCSGACSFCLTKVARPGLRSYPVEAIAADVARAVREGAREIRLTSQDTAAFGLDSGTDLASVLRAVCAVEGEFRVRVGMMNPFALQRDLSPLLEAFAHPKVFKFLHLPVQSGSARVLHAMRRGHDARLPMEQAAAFRARFPDLFLATDVIVGHPGEEDADFEDTVALVQALKPDMLNVTRFSARAGTPAAEMEAPHGRVAKARSRILTALRDEIGARRFGEWVGREVEALVTEPGKPGTVLARTDDYRQVVLPDDAPLGSRVRARITGATPFFLTGVIPSASSGGS